MRALIEVRARDGMADGEFSLGIVNIYTRQSVIPPLPFKTRSAAEKVRDLIVELEPTLYTADHEKARALGRWGE